MQKQKFSYNLHAVDVRMYYLRANIVGNKAQQIMKMGAYVNERTIY